MAERQLNFNQALNEAMRQEMQRDPTVILLGEDVAGGADVEHLHGEDAWGRGAERDQGPRPRVWP